MNLKLRFISKSIVPCPFWELDSCSADQGVSCLLRNLNVRYCVHKNPTLGPNLSCLKSVRTLISFTWRQFIILSSHVSTYQFNGVYPIWPSVLVENHYTWLYLLLQTSMKMSYTDSGCSEFQSHANYLLFSSCQRIHSHLKPFMKCSSMLVLLYGEEFLVTSQFPKHSSNPY
jgi:hypothetical protein